MKTVPLREAKQSLSGYVDHAQRERVLITRHGRPAALVIGVEGRDLEDIMLSSDPAFWELIETRRKEPTVSMADVRSRLGIPGGPAKTKKPRVKPRRR
ncbi:MAG: type II toxin-antitoxin system Phd/YefM family antitoxin [Anaeromyxobacter sp.]